MNVWNCKFILFYSFYYVVHPIVNRFKVRRQMVFVLIDRLDYVYCELIIALMCLAISSTSPTMGVQKKVFDKSPIRGKIERTVLDFSIVLLSGTSFALADNVLFKITSVFCLIWFISSNTLFTTDYVSTSLLQPESLIILISSGNCISNVCIHISFDNCSCACASKTTP